MLADGRIWLALLLIVCVYPGEYLTTIQNSAQCLLHHDIVWYSGVAGELFGKSDATKPRNRKLDIVITHYSVENIAEAVERWSEVLNRTYIQALSPYIFLYCQNQASIEHDLAWFADRGEVIHIPNLGRESHAYLWHIVNNYGNLALHTVFHQDISNYDKGHVANKLSLLKPETGMLALGGMSMCTCDKCFLKEIPKLREIWAMAQHTFCSPHETYPVFCKVPLLFLPDE